ncbi:MULTISPECIES: acyl carrier protein phosphodiesterase [Cellulophaga]|uniref:Acyl carrier protein phosphodiesterase n=1 Tax=Cellulophaga geojensis KL-A TaxID=1328323 RepID=A0ABN0RSI5_9FLAO|nr:MULTISPECIES: acyl carrier protein phosphodiesterase [Cellulophaga]AIM61617.1 ACP phosphodiesterase [Cellulophaga lytica]EWH14814.1 Acyl carrier protein phosphodiesterase [Cellulophaga geojensis KL-A]MDO6853119.1 acyl carrier protein phosphodiesterase [Cellulophaga lytica]TVZ10055.1 acyl carrier protein phosphodiesterase [Cellulophaga sp. RHA_52]SNQ44654.1 Acyl carrier protein phosphodiesterase [Cellulophaga lytica]
MNFLAHIYLSFEDDEITIGNFIADSIRGNKYKHLPKKIQKGITLHRHIDTFTDAHKTVRKSTKKLHENYGHYSGVIVDIFYDHFLAKNWKNYSDTPLDEFVEKFYDLLEDNYLILPENTKRMMPYMIADNWILSYASLTGISKVLDGMNRRTKNRSKMNFAIVDLKEHYNEFEDEFTSFFEELTTFAKQKYTSLLEEE